MPRFRVAAGILHDSNGRVLIAERVGGGPFQGMWEFPGGKIGDGESPEQALERELSEELGIELGAIKRFMHIEHDYADRSVAIDFFLVLSWVNEPRGIEGQQLRWVETQLLAEHNLLPADVPVIEALQQMAS
ncbi:MAG: 8-oxo-dGTP diphosphatase MutT [Gammaproteobacteria bacterium]|jgi:8-oxo-dGTP diphosphatase|nr:8-oxo-dGTP diphosphatase MutT [Gammaproteobacteria bacterium]MDH3906574.1 8-oxo-dGTP diphosphatase MutT [Gammaproteobacteria bacterium]MDH3953883.1 8-oxo-dGTP diphosphatase MutT [Gammaproteobacteria bacterium]MDH4005678.1 8-oxo-dGTP diphosphatase MutT [Gammaproteobacteria bacterium]